MWQRLPQKTYDLGFGSCRTHEWTSGSVGTCPTSCCKHQFQNALMHCPSSVNSFVLTHLEKQESFALRIPDMNGQS